MVMDNKAVFALSSIISYLLFRVIDYYNRKKTVRSCPIIKLIIYPIKSLKGIEVNHLDVVLSGVKWKSFHDREFSILDKHNNVISQRVKPQLSLVNPSFHGNEIWVDAPGMPDTLKLSPNVESKDNEIVNFKIWGHDTQGKVYSAEASQWFSSYLDCEAKFVYFTDGLLQQRTTPPGCEPSNAIVYQDGFPVLVVNQASVDDLNKRLSLDNQVTVYNFRPNFVLESTQAFSEDLWTDVHISGINFKIAKPCDRCSMVNVDQEKGVRMEGGEPLTTLRKYRIKEELKHLFKEAPLFGVLLIPTNEGTIRLGDVLNSS